MLISAVLPIMAVGQIKAKIKKGRMYIEGWITETPAVLTTETAITASTAMTEIDCCQAL